MTSVIVEHSCSLSVAICNFLRIVIVIITLSQKLTNDALDHTWIYPDSTTKQRSSSGPCSSLTISLNYPLSTKPIYAAFVNENIINYPRPIRLSGAAMHDEASVYLIRLDATQHEDVECSLCINMKTFWGHFFYSNPKLMQAFLYCALLRELNILCMTVT